MAESRSRSRRSEQGGRRKNRKKHKAPSTVRTRRSPLRPVLPAASSEQGGGRKLGKSTRRHPLQDSEVSFQSVLPATSSPVSSAASTCSRSPARRVARRRSESSATSDDPSAPGTVYLLNERATGRAAAGIKLNQLTFMQLQYLDLWTVVYRSVMKSGPAHYRKTLQNF